MNTDKSIKVVSCAEIRQIGFIGWRPRILLFLDPLFPCKSVYDFYFFWTRMNADDTDRTFVCSAALKRHSNDRKSERLVLVLAVGHVFPVFRSV